MQTVLTLATLEGQVRQRLQAQDLAGLRGLLTGQHPADVADVIDRLAEVEQVQVFRLLDPDQAGDVLSETSVGATRRLIESLPPSEAALLFNHISLDDIVEILGEDVPHYRQTLLKAMGPQVAQEARALLTYPPRSAGRLMTQQFVRVRPEMTVAQGLQLLRRVGQSVETITDLYSLDPDDKLIGVVALRDILAAPPEQPLRDLTHTDPIVAAPETDQEEVARLVSQYDLFALPVIARDGRLLGIVTVDDVIDVLVEENTEDVLRMGAIQAGPSDESYFGVPIWRAINRRVGWLLLLFLAGTVTINVLQQFQATLAQVVALSFFMPLLIGTGGNTGAQTVSTMVRGLALGHIQPGDVLRVVGRELTSGLLLGCLLGAAALVLALLLGNTLPLAAVVALSIIAICTWANTMGALVPIGAQRFGLDPALVSSPLITTLVDATGLTIYMLIAKALLGI